MRPTNRVTLCRDCYRRQYDRCRAREWRARRLAAIREAAIREAVDVVAGPVLDVLGVVLQKMNGGLH